MPLDDSFVFTVYDWFRSAMAKSGRKINCSKTTDFTKTYQYRWIKTFVEKCNQLNLDEKTVKYLIYDMVDYAKRNDLLSKGTQILLMSNLVDICHHSLKTLIAEEHELIREILYCHRFLVDQAGGKDIQVQMLISTTNRVPNILLWFDQGRLTNNYLALSSVCLKALQLLESHHRSMFPSNFDLLKLYSHIMLDQNLGDKIESIMGSTLRKIKTQKTRK